MKFVILGILVFLFYRLLVKPKQIDKAPDRPPIQDNDTEFVDYEEVDE